MQHAETRLNSLGMMSIHRKFIIANLTNLEGFNSKIVEEFTRNPRMLPPNIQNLPLHKTKSATKRKSYTYSKDYYKTS